MREKAQSGQALVEFIIFLPFMLMMYTVVVGLGDSIHASINQQKAARGYFYYRIQNSAHVTRPTANFRSWELFGHFFIGWSDYLEGKSPVYPCYRINLPFAPGAGDACAEQYTTTTTQYIRVGTVYGVCGATYTRSSADPGLYSEQPAGSDGNMPQVLNKDSCLIK